VPSQIILSGCPSAIVSLSTCVATATLEDAYANVETLDNSSVITFSEALGGGTVSGLTSPTVSGGVANVTLTGARQGLVLVSATGDSLTSNTLTVTVNAATTTVVASSLNPSVVGQTLTYTATVTVNSAGTGTPSGNIELLDNGTAIGICGGAGGVTVNGSGQVTCAVSWPTTATQTITAQYLGNAGAYYLGSTSSALSQTVNRAATTTAVTSGPNPSVLNQSVSYIATVTATSPGSGTPTGNIEFFDGGTAISTCGGATGMAVTSGSATCAVTYATPGSHTITAQYLGDANYLASALSLSVSQVVNQVPAITSASSTTFTVGSAGSFTVTDTGFPVPALTNANFGACVLTALPSGVTFNTSTGVLAGTPVAGTAGTYTLCLNASNVAGSATQAFTLTVNTARLVYSATGTATTFTTAGAYTVNYPTGTNTSDLLFLVVENSANNVPTTPTGWTLLTDQSVTSPQALNFAFYWKLAAGETSVSVTDTGTSTGASAWVVRYVRPGGYPPIPVSATAAVGAGNAAASATLTPSPDVTTNLANATVISIVAIRAANTLSLSTPHGFAFENTVTSTPGSASLALGVGDQFVPTVGGSDTSPTWSQTGTAAQWAWVTVAFS
jgi:hypothetical protein